MPSISNSQLSKLSAILNAMGSGQQRTMLVDSSNAELGTAANSLSVSLVGAAGITVTVDSEFPAAAATTDNFVTPTTTNVMSMGMVYDGATWDMLRGDATNGMLVNIGGASTVTLTGVADNLDGEVGLVTASLLYGRTSDATAGIIQAGALGSFSDDYDGFQALTTASALIARVDANTVLPVGMIDTIYSLKTDTSSIAGTATSVNAGTLDAGTQRVTIATDDEVNNLLGTIDTDTGVIAGDTTSLDTKIGNTAKAEVTLAARPADTTLYTIGDVVNANGVTIPVAFTAARANDTTGWVIGGKATSSAVGATLPQIDLLLFDATFAIAADNAVFAPSDAEILNYIGKVTFNSFTGYSTTASACDGTVKTPISFVPASGTRLIYGVPVILNGYTPVSGEIFSFSLDLELN